MKIASLSPDLLILAPVFVLSFLLLLSTIVFFHEFGHFAAARLLGVRVDVFSIGFGKTLLKWKDKSGTIWRIALLPLGGYVKFFGDAGPASNAEPAVAAEKAETEGHSTTQFPRPGGEKELARRLTPEERAVCFHFKPVWARALIVAAGPIANFILAILFFWALLLTFGVQVVDPVIGEVMKGSAAEAAGFKAGDKIVTANGREIRNFDDLTMLTRLSTGEEIAFVVDRSGETIAIVATPRRQVIEDSLGNEARSGVLGVRPDVKAVRFERYGAIKSLGIAADRVWGVITSTGKFLSRLVIGKEEASQLGGPIKMAQYAGQAAMSGFDSDDKSLESLDLLTRLKISLGTFVNLAAVVSVSIGFLNLLPVPVLDGGHLMYYAYEAAAGKPLGVRAQAIGFQLGIVLLASFMIFVTWNDITGFFAVKS